MGSCQRRMHAQLLHKWWRVKLDGMRHWTGRGARTWGLLVGSLASIAAYPASADCPQSGVVELRFTPTGRAQIALWVERADGVVMQTVRLTQAVAYRGIGNRPGAMQFNSGFRWPYGRREGVLPVWAHHRAAIAGNDFPRVIFQDRLSEGHASRSSNDYSSDDYFCLSFQKENSKKEALDAVSCASILRTDKGRYVTQNDLSKGYAEPSQDGDGTGAPRPLSGRSLYPPRRDVERCVGSGCYDHPDLAQYRSDALRVMPEIDAVTMATPADGSSQAVPWFVPPDWAAGDYVAYLEVNVEGDYNDSYNPQLFPTPTQPAGAWDSWAQNYGYPYRGQPSVVYAVPFRIGADGGSFSASAPMGYGSLDGVDGEIRPLDGSISDDPRALPGSGADRLRWQGDRTRLQVEVRPTTLCPSGSSSGSSAAAECSQSCSATVPCSDGYVCGSQGTCVGMCDECLPPEAVQDLVVSPHPDPKQSHHWARLSFRVPASPRRLQRYEVRFRGEAIVDSASFAEALPANAASIDSVELMVPVTAAAGELVETDFGGLKPDSKFSVAVRAVDLCYASGPIVAADVKTTAVQYTKVSPCFVATAAYGAPMAAEVQTLRRFRDRWLMPTVLGRLAVQAYYRVGPYGADFIRRSAWRRTAARVALAPWVGLARWLLDE